MFFWKAVTTICTIFFSFFPHIQINQILLFYTSNSTSRHYATFQKKSSLHTQVRGQNINSHFTLSSQLRCNWFEQHFAWSSRSSSINSLFLEAYELFHLNITYINTKIESWILISAILTGKRISSSIDLSTSYDH